MEATRIKMNMGGTIRAKVLQYKSDGNTLTEKWHTLTKFAEGIYLSYTTPDRFGHRSANVVFSKNGIFWRIGGEPEHYFNPKSFRYSENMETLKKRFANYEADIMQAVKNGGWLNKLHITVMARLGHDTTAMTEAYLEMRRRREELDRRKAEEAERRERERIEAEERRKAEALADGKEKLLKHERITVEQIELIAEAVGYKINIRTLGFMRKKVTEAVLREDDTATVWGYKLTSRNIDGTANVMRELYNRLKAQAEEEANEPIKHISEIMETCRLHDENTGEETDEYKYYKWLAGAHCGKYRTIADKALAEAFAWIFEAAYRNGKGHIITMNEDGMLAEAVIAATPAETPQISTETAETTNVSAKGMVSEISRLIEKFGFGFSTAPDNGDAWRLHDGKTPNSRPITGYMSTGELFRWLSSYSTGITNTHAEAESGYRVCSHCGKRFHEGYFLGDEYACSHECAVALYSGDEDQLAADLEEEEREPGTTECYLSVW